jgi:hypothetical protein
MLRDYHAGETNVASLNPVFATIRKAMIQLNGSFLIGSDSQRVNALTYIVF